MAADLHDWQSNFVKQLHGFQSWINSYKMSVPFPEIKRDLRQSHMEIRGDVLRIIRNELNALGSVKSRLTARIELRKQVDLGGDELSYFTRQENPILIKTYNPRAIIDQLNAALDRQLEELAGWTERGSGWVVDAIEMFYLDFARNDPLRGGHYLPLPKDLKAKGAIIRWALRAAKFPVTKNPQRPSKYPTDDGLDFTGISFRTPLIEIPKIEKLNNIAINVLGFDNKTKKVRILYVSEMKGENIPSYNFLLITKGSISHYCHIKNFSRLLYSQQHSEGNHYHYCIRCLQGFSSQAVFQKHRTLYRGSSSRPTRIDMPEKGENTLKFQNHQRQMKAPYVIYADFESIIENYDTCISPTDRSSTTKTEVHKPCGFSLVAVRSDSEVKDKQARCYRGEDCVKQFLATLLQTEMEIREELTHKKKMTMTKEDWRAFDRAKKCHICKEDLIRHNEKDETELWDSEAGAYCGKVHKYKQAPQIYR